VNAKLEKLCTLSCWFSSYHTSCCTAWRKTQAG